MHNVILVAVLVLCFLGPTAIFRFLAGVITLLVILAAGVLLLLWINSLNDPVAPQNGFRVSFAHSSSTPYIVASPGPTPKTFVEREVGDGEDLPYYLRSQEEYDRLPNGTWLTDSSGRVFRK
jgi:hypothetical protein